MKRVTKADFKRLYFERGGGDATGWGLSYWNKFFVDYDRSDMDYLVEEPPTPTHTRMMIVTDHGAKEHRLFFLTEEAGDHFCEFPGDD